MIGNNYQALKEMQEDEIIRHIDTVWRVIKAPRPVEITLRVSIMELIAYRAAMTGRPINLAWCRG